MVVPCIPYSGSKRKIATRIVERLPSAHTFYDLFSGGGAVTSAALMSGKFSRVVMNDVQPGMTRFYHDAVMGRYNDRTEWVSRDDFNAKKNTDMFVSYLWSFGNNGRQYLYGRSIELYKKAWHHAVAFEDYSLLKDIGLDCGRLVGATRQDRKLAMRKWVRDNEAKVRAAHFEMSCLKSLKSLESLESLERLERLQSLKSLESLERFQSLESLERLESLKSLESLERFQSLESLETSYDKVFIDDEDCVVYCDPPYANTNKSLYKSTCGSFDSLCFWDWVRRSPHLVMVSEYNAPRDFVSVCEIPHRCTINNKVSNTVMEKLFVHESKVHLVDLMKVGA